MAKQELDGAQIRAVSKEIGGETVAQLPRQGLALTSQREHQTKKNPLAETNGFPILLEENSGSALPSLNSNKLSARGRGLLPDPPIPMHQCTDGHMDDESPSRPRDPTDSSHPQTPSMPH